MKDKNLLPMNIQFFADGENGSENEANGENIDVEQAAKEEERQEDKKGGDEKSVKKEKMFTQEEVDKILSERLKRISKETNRVEDIKDLLAEIRESKAENHALRCGVTEKNLDYVLALAKTKNNEDVKEAIDEVLKDFPFLVGKKEPAEEKGDEDENTRGAIKASVGKAGVTKKTITKDEINNIKDSVERRKAIRENIELFI